MQAASDVGLVRHYLFDLFQIKAASEYSRHIFFYIGRGQWAIWKVFEFRDQPPALIVRRPVENPPRTAVFGQRTPFKHLTEGIG
ncbi:hypothetical protein SAMN05444000_1525 [Shimia gijangensis]|uniref:Uncharacterized protein n=1 Tax=Shimia gijangensis TaxID=1470563 RepID=A0A1M6U538_9RHOB|nr:hypothetical protein SAMN05444000_1525 [Shimia gijangensis]